MPETLVPVIDFRSLPCLYTSIVFLGPSIQHGSRMEGERRLVETLMAVGRLEEAEQAAGANLAICVEAGLQVSGKTLQPRNLKT